jgi:hypothetical protein
MRIQVKIQGLTPLLMHKFVAGADKITKDMLPRVVAETYTYRNKDGELYIPSDAILKSMQNAGKWHKVGRSAITNSKSSLVPAGVSISAVFGDGNIKGLSLSTIECLLGTKDFEVDSRPVVNNNIKARLMCHRPRLDQWETNFEMEVDDEIFHDSKMGTEKRIRMVLDDAGKKVGLLSFRPACGGSFGRFVVTKWVIEK